MHKKDSETVLPEVVKVRRTGWGSRLLIAFTFLLAFFTVCSAWVSLFHPAKYWYISITGLGFPILFVLNLLTIIYWALRRKHIVWIPVAAFLFTIVKLPAIYQLKGTQIKPVYVEGQSPELKVMSYNVRLFDLYNWSHNLQTKEKIFVLLEGSDPDILCLQEFYSADDKQFNNFKRLKESLRANQVHVEYPITLHKTDHWGIATYSAYPIVNKGVLYFDQKTANICIYTDLKIEADTVRVYNCHLESVRFGAAEYKFIENLGNSEAEEETVERTRNILKRLKNAFIKRAAQADLIASHIKASPYPVIVCGDFNDTPLSYTYQQLSEGLNDSFRESGGGMGSTYSGPIPGLRIDYILQSPRFSSYEFNILRSKLSDHYPVLSKMVLEPE